MNTPFISNPRHRIITAFIYSMSAPLTDGRASPPVPLASFMLKIEFAHIPAYLLCILYHQYLLHDNSLNLVGRKPFALFLSHPSTLSRVSYMKLHQISQIHLPLPNSSLLTPKHLMPSYFISTLKKQPKLLPFTNSPNPPLGSISK